MQITKGSNFKKKSAATDAGRMKLWADIYKITQINNTGKKTLPCETIKNDDAEAYRTNHNLIL